jgi:hypothetical protein
MFGRVLLSGRWAEYQFWIALPLAAAYVATGIGFMFARRWARRTMAALVPVAALFFLDMLLMFGWVGSRAGVWSAVAALGIAGYTLLFLVISTSWRLYGSP